MKILITGIAGFIGSHLAEWLIQNDHHVSGIDNLNDFYSPDLKRANLQDLQQVASQKAASVKFYEGDIRDEVFVLETLKKESPDVIIHLAAMAGVRPSIQRPLLYEDVNCRGTLILLEACQQLNIRNFIFGSSSSVYGLNQKVPFAEDDLVNQPFSPYAQTKRAGELQCRVYHELYKINIACLRFFTVYGPRQRPDLAIRKFTDLIFNNKKIPIFGDGSFARDFTFIDDIIDGIVKSMQWACEGTLMAPRYDIFNLGESATTTVNQMIDLIERNSGIKALRDYQPQMPGDVPITFADISKSKKILGYNPQTKIEEGIPKFLDWFKTL